MQDIIIGILRAEDRILSWLKAYEGNYHSAFKWYKRTMPVISGDKKELYILNYCPRNWTDNNLGY